MRANHLIANEMADIDGDGEFEDILGFVLNQGCNVCQQKRANTVQTASKDTHQTASADLDEATTAATHLRSLQQQ